MALAGNSKPARSYADVPRSSRNQAYSRTLDSAVFLRPQL
ncbi:uncharacterized protein FFB14_11080 [Fusarium fujikuroi]|nr:uncharacterized protein FFB14_11080 [Fusarium fujikuroi]